MKDLKAGSKLSSLVENCRNSYANNSYPYDETERALAANVQKAISELGYEALAILK